MSCKIFGNAPELKKIKSEVWGSWQDYSESNYRLTLLAQVTTAALLISAIMKHSIVNVYSS